MKRGYTDCAENRQLKHCEFFGKAASSFNYVMKDLRDELVLAVDYLENSNVFSSMKYKQFPKN